MSKRLCRGEKKIRAHIRLLEGGEQLWQRLQGFVVSLGTLHNLYLPDLLGALKEIQRVSRSQQKYVIVESYRNEREKMNLLYWQLTCESFFTPHEWEWMFSQSGYEGDYGFIYFE